MRMLRCLLPCLLLAAVAGAAEPLTLRLYQGATIHINNPTGAAFELRLAVRDLNLFSEGPRELLFKVYTPTGATPVREVIPDDGVRGAGLLPRTGGWDHELWYYAYCYGSGSAPMFPWSTFSRPDRLALMPAREFVRQIPAGPPGVYRLVLVGTADNYVTVHLPPALKVAVSGSTTWLHGHGELFRESQIWVPKGSTRLHFGLIEMDPPQTRHFTLTGPDGQVLFDGPATNGFREQWLNLPKDGAYDEQLLKLTVSAGPGDFMVHGTFNLTYQRLRRPGDRPYSVACQMVLAPDAETARAVRGGTIWHDGELFFHPFQVRFHDWLKAQPADSFVVRDAAGKVIEPTPGTKIYGRSDKGALGYWTLPSPPGFVELNGMHEAPPFSDLLMHGYREHRNPGVLAVALRDLHQGFMAITTNDHNASGAWTNLGYTMGTYAFHFWRPAMRVLRDSDAPPEVKAILREALLLAGDRLSFATSIERVNGNAFSHIPIALKYCAEATQDPIQQERFKVYFERFATEGWGAGAGLSRSGDLQEHFAHDNHYGSYLLANVRAPLADFPNCEFLAVSNRLRQLYSYVWCPDGLANPWSSRTHHTLARAEWAQGDLAWQGEPGPDFTVDVNDGHEWFAARRPNYYVVTFHGRLAPAWLTNGFHGQLGFGGGILCQLTVPGKGLVLHSRLKADYGEGMALPNWRNFEIHSVVGTLADGRPFVGGVSEHDDARLEGQTLSSSGEVRDRPIRVSRRYTFAADHIVSELQLSGSGYSPLLTLWTPGRASKLHTLTEAWEMIPYTVPANGKPPTITLRDAAGQELPGYGTELVKGVSSVRIDRGGFGVQLGFEAPVAISKGGGHALLIRLIDAPTVADKIALKYTITPF